MKRLTAEERAAKFAAKPKTYGLRSRGHRKLTVEEQQALFNDLKNQKPSAKLDSLRVLREAVSSSSANSRDLEADVYAISIHECIRQDRLEAVPPMLAHMTSISQDQKWARLYSIALANTKQFHEAFVWCHDDTDEQYVTSVVLRDAPLRKKIMGSENNKLVIKLMSQLDSQFSDLEHELEAAFRHPAKKRLPPG